MPNTTTLNENIRTIDGTEWIRVATPGANWRMQVSALESFLAAPLTSANDTNITITLGGSPATALLAATSLTMGWTGNLALSRFDNTGTTSQILQGGNPSTWSATPTIGTSVTCPLVIGGTTASSTLTLRSTSGAGTSDSVVIQTGSQVTAATFTTAQHTVLANLLDISAAAAGQIQFPTTQNASANANTLDDYHEGTWTPSLGGTATYSTQDGRYTKIGHLVWISCRIIVGTIGTGSVNTISGLPFTMNNNTLRNSLAVSFYGSAASTFTWVGAHVLQNTTTIGITAIASATANVNASPTFFGSSTEIILAGVYEATN